MMRYSPKGADDIHDCVVMIYQACGLDKKIATLLGCYFLEVLARFELADQSFADSCLTTWLQYHMKSGTPSVPDFGAGDEARTRYLHLGKVALYRMSYTRKFGASGRNRTNDTRIFSPLLYLLSYRGI